MPRVTELSSASSAQANPSDLGRPDQLLAVFLCGTLAFLELYCTQPLLPYLAKVFHASEVSASLTVSACTLGVAVSAALISLFAESISRKKLIVRAMFTQACVVALTATAPSLGWLAFWRFVQGLITPAIFTITIAYVTEEWPALRVPRVMSIYVAGTVFGGFAGRVSGGMLTEHFGWRSMFVVLAAAAAAGAVATQYLLPASRVRSATQQHSSIWSPILRNLANPRLRATFGIGFCMLFALVGTFSYITFYLAGPPFGLTTAQLSWLFSVYLVGLVATLLAGTSLARIGLRLGMLGAVGLCLSGVALTLIPSLVAVGFGLSLASSGVFIGQTCANSFLREAAPSGSRVSAAGMYVVCYYVGGTVGGVAPGLVWRSAGWPGATALIAALLTVAGLLAFFGWQPGKFDSVHPFTRPLHLR